MRFHVTYSKEERRHVFESIFSLNSSSLSVYILSFNFIFIFIIIFSFITYKLKLKFELENWPFLPNFLIIGFSLTHSEILVF